MSKNSVVSLTLLIKGQQASQEMKRITTEQVTAVQRINTEQQKLAPIQAGQINNAKKISDELRKQGQAFTTQKREALALDTARKLGIRTEQQINAEIKKTRDTYAQFSILQRQGLVTTKDMERAYASMKSRVAALNTELGKTVSTEKQIQQIQKTGGSGGMSTLQRGGAIAGAATAGYYAARNVAASPLDRGRNFEKKVFDAATSVTNGFEGMSKEQIKATNIELMEYAKNAVRKGHGTVEGVSEAAGILAASGNYEKVSDLKAPLLAVAKSAFAANASETDMAKLVQQTKQFGVPLDRSQAALDRMMSSGFAGGFELSDMAQFLPVVLGAATKAGYGGEKGLNTVTTHLQLARKYTGTPGEAATNIEDLYGLVNQKHFKDAIAKNISVEAGDPTKAGKKGAQVLDLTQYLVDNQLKGVDSTTAIANLMNRQLSKNSEYNKLNSELALAVKNKNNDQADRLKQAIELVIAGQFGDVFHNKQSLSGISSIVTGVKSGSFDEIYNKSWNGEGAVEKLSVSRYDQNGFAKAEALEQEKILAQIKIYDTASEKLGEFQKNLVSIMQGNQGLTAATLAATGALTVLAGAAGGAALGGALGGGKGGLLGKVGGAVAGVSGAAGGAAGIARVGGQFAVAGAAGYGIGTGVRNMYMNTETGQDFDDKLGGGIAHVLAAFGNDEAKAAIEAQAKYDQMLAQQEQGNKLSADIINKLNSLIAVTSQNKPLPFPTMSGGGLLGDISKNAATEEKRHGAALLMYKPN